MPQLTYPWVLPLAALVPVLIWLWLRPQRSACRLPAGKDLKDLPRLKFNKTRWGGAMLRGLAVLAVLAALAGPRWPDERTRIRSEGIALLLAVDVSGSMAEQDFAWQGQPVSRLEAARTAFRLFVSGGDANGVIFPGRPHDLVGLVTFAARPQAVCPLTMSHAVPLKMLEEERPRSVPGESETNLSDAIALGLERLTGQAAYKHVLILLSDGEHNVPRTASDLAPIQAAQLAANLGVTIYTVDTGPAPTDPSGGPTDEAEARRAAGRRTLAEISRLTGGRSFEAGDTGQLLQAMQEIDGLERRPIDTFQYRRYHEAYPWLGLAGFGLWTAAVILDLTSWRQLPLG